MKIKDYEEYDDYDDGGRYGRGGYQKIKSKKDREKQLTKEHKARRKEAEFWNTLENQLWVDDSVLDTIVVEQPQEESTHITSEVPEKLDVTTLEAQVPTTQPAVKAPAFETSINTHTIKGNIIDFERVAGIEKVENEYGGKLTYGIKFLFVGKKGLSRTAWFNKNVTERDAVYIKEYTFWTSLSEVK